MSYELIESERFDLLLDQVSFMQEQINVLLQKENPSSQKFLYTNKEVVSLLGIGDKLLKKYRDTGKLGYHQEQNKYWYTQTDLDQFLGKNYFPVYN
jgi:hypothetical protein